MSQYHSDSNGTLPRWLKIFESLSYPDMRVLSISTLSNQISQGLQQVILGYMVLMLTDSHIMVGMVYATRSAPNLLVGLVAGSVTDRIDRRVLMSFTIWSMAVVSLLMAGLVFVGQLTVWGLIFTTFMLGCFQAFYMTARQVYVYDLVGSTGAVNGIAITSFAQRLGQIVGALAGGFLLHWAGPTLTFLFMALCFTLGGVANGYLKRQGESAPGVREGLAENISNYFKALRTNRLMLILIISTALAETFGFSHQVLLPILAQDVLHVGSIGLGVLTAFRFVGGAIGVISLAAVGDYIGKGKLLIALVVLFGVGQMLMSFSGTMWMAIMFVMLTNMMAASSDVLHQSLLQLSVPNEQRGRAMGSWIVGIGSAPFGQLQIGYISGSVGPQISLIVNGAILIISAVIMGSASPKLRRL